MENKKTEQMPQAVPYIVFEDAMVRHERMVKRLIIGIVISIVLLFASNMAWLAMWSQYDTVDYMQDGEGLNNICTGSQGDVSYESTTENANQEEQTESEGHESPYQED